MSKYFVVNPSIQLQDKKIINQLRQEQEIVLSETFSQRRKEDVSKLSEEDNLQYVEGRVIVKIDMDSKDSWTFESGGQIEYKRKFNNFNVRETEACNAIVISSEYIKKGTEILVHPNAVHDTNRIFDYKNEVGSSIMYYSIPKGMCFAYYEDGWKPLVGFDFALRVFKPYEGFITGIDPTLVKDVLFVTTGELKNKVVKTLKACDYEIVFQDVNGREGNIIRFRPFGDEAEKREEEAIAVMNDLTDKVSKGEYLVGITIKDAKKYE